MSVVTIQAERQYEVHIDVEFKEALKSISKHREKIAFIFSENMRDQINDLKVGDAESFYFPVADSEAAKSTKTLLQLWDWLGAAGFTRSDLIVGIGGGAVTDFAGYLAASWLRGLDWVAWCSW